MTSGYGLEAGARDLFAAQEAAEQMLGEAGRDVDRERLAWASRVIEAWGWVRTPEEMALALATLEVTVFQNPWIPVTPTERQLAFLALPHREAFYGGAAGGGKSYALLMAALQYVEQPGYAALILRRTYADLALPGALMSVAEEWLGGKARWSAMDHTWTFPSGATLTFGYLEHERDKHRYRSSQFQLIAFDELTQFSESSYRYLFSRLRRPEKCRIPLRMRAASNPGDVGHAWVKQRFIVEGRRARSRIFIPARLEDNPHLDAEEYRRALAQLDPVERRRLLEGDWDVQVSGGKFRREWFRIVDDWPRDATLVRYWDLAATAPRPGRDPDWTAGVLVAFKKGQYWVVDVKRVRATPAAVEALMRQTAELDGWEVPIYVEQEGGASGAAYLAHLQRDVLVGFNCRGRRPSGSKIARADVVSSAAEAGNVFLVRGEWLSDYLEELEQFPHGVHDDQVDATSGAFAALAEGSGGPAVAPVGITCRSKWGLSAQDWADAWEPPPAGRW